MNTQYERLIDGADYQTIESYLRNPSSPIQYILHVREKEMLPQLAAELDKAIAKGKAAPENIRGLLLRRIERGDLLVTATRPLLIPVDSLVPTATVPADTYCRVIYLPPFYLSHTEGLFESIQNRTQVKPEVPRQAPRIKP